MAQKMGDEDKLLLLVLGVAGVLGLYYLTAGYDRENNAALMPDSLEDRIDKVVGELNARVGRNWGNWGAESLKHLLRKLLPGNLVALVDVVYAVEQESRRVAISGHAKRQRASALATAYQLH